MTDHHRQKPPRHGARSHSLTQRLIAGLLLIAFELATVQVGVDHVLTLGMGHAAQAAPVADPTAPLRFQPGIGQTSGSAPVPVVNITAPNAAGASLNRYRQFNVDAGGLVINNSSTGGGTLLGGSVAANPLLNGRAASVIINEVGSGFDASAINGAIEVFGPRADLVIANPNGIACNGCGFVNTPRITLTTGTPRFLDAPNGAPTAFDSAVAWGYDVRGGDIRIGAPGGQAGIEGTVGQIDLIAQNIALHAPLRAGTAANLVSGRQWVTFDAAGNVVVAANGDNSGAGYAIDASELGAVTAGRITLIATADGPGVRADGRLAASTGDLVISANGDVALARTYASGKLRAAALGAMTLNGDALASGDMTLHAGRGLDTDALSAHDIRLEAGGAISSGAMQSDTAIDVRAGGGLTTHGTLTAADAVTLAAQQDIGIGAGVHSGAVLDVSSRNGAVTISGGASADKALTLDAKAGNLTVRGALFAGTSLNAHAGADLSLDGQVTALADLTLNVQGTATLGGVSIAAGNATVTSGRDMTLAGSLIAGGDITLESRSRVAQAAGLTGAAGTLNVTGEQGVASKGAMIAGASARISSASGAVQVAHASAGADLTISAAKNSESETLEAQGDILQTAGAAIVNRGMVVAGGTLVQHAGGDIAQAGASVGKRITATADGDISYGNTTVAGMLDLKSKQQIILDGTVDAGAATLAAAGSLVTTGGVQKIRGALDAEAASMTLDADATSAGHAVYKARTGDLQGVGVLQSGGDLTLKAGGRVERSKLAASVGKLTVAGDKGVRLADTLGTAGSDIGSAQGDVALAGVTASGGSLTVSAAGDLVVDKAVVARGKAGLGAGGNIDINATLDTLADVRLDAGRTLSIRADVHADGQATLTGADIVNQAQVLSGGDLVMQARGSLASGAVATGGNATLGGAAITMGGANVTGNLTVNGGDITLTTEVLVRGASTLRGGAVTNRASLITGKQLTLTANSLTNDAGSALFAVGDTTVNAADIRNAGGIFGANVTLTGSGGFDNSGGLVLGKGDVAVHASALTGNRDGKILSVANLLLDITGTLANSGGLIHADHDLTLLLHGATFDPTAASNGQLSLNDKLTIVADGFNNNGDWTVPGNALDLQIQNAFTNRGLLQKAGDLRIVTPAAIDNTGQIVSGGTLTLDGAAIINSGLLHANQDLTLTTRNDLTNSGLIQAVGNMTLDGAALDNRNTNQSEDFTAGIAAAGDMQITMRQRVDNSAGRIAAKGKVTVTAPEVRNDRGAPVETMETTRSRSRDVLDGMMVETNRSALVDVGGEGGGQVSVPVPDRALGSYLPDYASNTVGSPATVWGREQGEGMGPVKAPIGDTITLPWVDVTTVTQREGRAGVIAAGRNLTINAPVLLSNRGGIVAATGNATLNVGQLDNGRAATLTNGTVETINPADHARFISDMNKPYYYYDPWRGWITEPLVAWELHPRTVDQRYQTPGQRGAIVAGQDFRLSGPVLVNSGNITVGGNATISAGASFTNQGDYTTQFTTTPGCMPGAVSCHDNSGAPRVETFAYRSDPNALLVGGSLAINAPVIRNTHATIAARGDVSLNADQVHNVAGVIQSSAADLVIKAREVVSRVEAPVAVHESWGNLNPAQAPGCNPGNHYKDSQCSQNHDIAASPAPVLAAARDVVITGDSLANTGGLIAAGRKVDIDMRAAATNTAQALSINWKGYWIEETGFNHDDIPHFTEGIVALPPQNAAIQAPTVQVRVGGLLQNTGNIVGRDVDLQGAHLVNGITTPNQPNPPPTGMRQVTEISQTSVTSAPLADARSAERQRQADIAAVDARVAQMKREHADAPLVVSMASVIGAANDQRKPGAASAETALPGMPAAVAAAPPAPRAKYAVATPDASRPDIAPAPTVHYLDTSAAQGAAVLGRIGPQQLLDRLPEELRGAAPLPFAYDPFTENQLLQRQALEATGRAYYLNGQSFDDRNQSSLDDQQKALFYTNAIAYAEAQRVAIGQALSEEQVAALDRPMLWYVEKQVPDASCRDIGALSQTNCPTLAALVPVLYLDRVSAERLSTQSLGLIAGENVTADFTGRIDNSGVINGANLTIATPEIRNTAREIDIGTSAYKVEGGWVEVTGTRIEAGGYVTAQKLAGEMQRWESVGGTLQIMNQDGSVDVAQTEALIGKLGSVLGVQSYSHTEQKDNIHVAFIKDTSGTFERLLAVVAAVALSFIIGPQVSAYIGQGAAAGSAMAAGAAATATTAAVTAGVGNIMLTGFVTGTLASVTGQFIATGEVDMESALKGGLSGALTAGLTEATGLNQMAGIRDMGDGLLKGTFNAAQTGQALLGIGGRALVSAAVSTTINGGSFEQAVLNSVAADVAALGANMIGQTMDGSTAWNSEGGLLHVLSHAALGCAVASISGQDCAAAAIGAATSAALLPRVGEAMDLTQQDKASPSVQLGMTVLSMLAGGVLAASTGHDPTTAAGAAQNEALNNYLTPKERATLAQARADCAAAGGNPDSAACMQRDSLMRLDAQRNAGLAQGDYSATQARQWQRQEYQAASVCPPPYLCAANANAVGLVGYWQGKAVGEQGLLPGYDPVDVLLGLSGVYGAGRVLVERLGRIAVAHAGNDGITLFRAVGPAELADIGTLSALRNLGSAEGKYFTTSAEAASYYAKQAVQGFGDAPYTLIETRVPISTMKGLSPATVDRGIPAWVIPNEGLKGLLPKVLDSMPIP